MSVTEKEEVKERKEGMKIQNNIAASWNRLYNPDCFYTGALWNLEVLAPHILLKVII